MVKKILGFIARHSGTILTVAAGAGVVATGVVAHKNTLKAATNDKGIKNYIPSIAVGAATIGVIIGMDILHVKKEKAILAMAGMAELTLNRYETMKELKEARELEGDGHIDDKFIGEVMGCFCEDIHESFSEPEAKMLCYEPITKTFFKASQVDLLLSEREINEAISNGGGVRVLDFLAKYNDQASKWVDNHNYGWWCDDCLSFNGSFFGNYVTALPRIEEHYGRICLTMYWSHEPWEMEPGFLPLP